MNLVYHALTRNMKPFEKAQLDRDIAPAELKEETIDRQNAEQMKLLQGMTIGPRAIGKPKASKEKERASE